MTSWCYFDIRGEKSLLFLKEKNPIASCTEELRNIFALKLIFPFNMESCQEERDKFFIILKRDTHNCRSYSS